MAPRHWPRNFFYSSESVSQEVHIDLIRLLLSSKNNAALEHIEEVLESKRVHPHIQILPIDTRRFKDHPLLGKNTKQGHVPRGVFAKESISLGVVLGEYVGEIRLFTQGENPLELFKGLDVSEYAWVANIQEYFYYVEPRLYANELAFVNDYRGIRSSPNVTTEWVIHRGRYYFCYSTTDEINTGEELVVDYGEEYWRYFFDNT